MAVVVVIIVGTLSQIITHIYLKILKKSKCCPVPLYNPNHSLNTCMMFLSVSFSVFLIYEITVIFTDSLSFCVIWQSELWSRCIIFIMVST